MRKSLNRKHMKGNIVYMLNLTSLEKCPGTFTVRNSDMRYSLMVVKDVTDEGCNTSFKLVVTQLKSSTLNLAKTIIQILHSSQIR